MNTSVSVKKTTARIALLAAAMSMIILLSPPARATVGLENTLSASGSANPASYLTRLRVHFK